MQPKHYFSNVPHLGNVAISRHAQKQMRQARIPQDTFESVLYQGEIIPEGFDILWRQGSGIRIVILKKPEPFHGALLVKTVFKIEPQKKVR